ncbi:MAG: VWA domain-containing protein [Ectothiorhodospiraceae bacterium]|nr:VWA domain-containing protein [Ectothiorhodospiraceae bacterium]
MRLFAPAMSHGLATLLGGVILATAMAVVAAATERDIVVVLDDSARLQESDPDLSGIGALDRFVHTLEGDVRIGLVLYGERAQLSVPLTALAAARVPVSEALQTLMFESGLANAAAGLERALYELGQHSRTGSEPAVVLLMTGSVETGDQTLNRVLTRWMAEDLAEEAASAGIRIYGIGVGRDADHGTLETLARKTGGEHYRVAEPGEYGAALTRIAALTTEASPALRETTAAATAVEPPPAAPEVPRPEMASERQSPIAREIPQGSPEPVSPDPPPAPDPAAAGATLAAGMAWVAESRTQLIAIIIPTAVLLALAGIGIALRLRRVRDDQDDARTVITQPPRSTTGKETGDSPTLIRPGQRPPHS